jgi:Tol biopolymer transport system component
MARWALLVAAAALGLAVGAQDGGSTLDGRGGGLIAFYSNRDGDSEIFVMNADGSGLTQLTHNTCTDNVPALSPDGRFVAFGSDRTGNQELFIMDLADGSARQVTHAPTVDTHPDWSPDGSQLAFARFSPGSWDDGKLFLLDVQSGEERQLTNHPGGDMRPAWSADGESLLFSSNRDGNYEIYSIATDGTGVRRLTDTALDELFPRPSPDGREIVYTLGDFANRRFAVHVMDAEGTNDRALTAGRGVSGEDPVWADRGEQIIFQTDRTGNFEIFVMNSDGSEQTNLTRMPSGEYWPSWSSGTPVP